MRVIINERRSGMARRGAGEGTIRQRTDGRWEARIFVTDPSGGRLRRSLLGRTRAAVAAKLAEAQQAEASGLPTATSRMLLSDYLAAWLEAAEPRVRPRTYESYELIVRVHLAPGLGHIVLTRLTPPQVQSFLNAKTRDGCSPRTVAYMRAVLRQALGQAERWGLVPRNVAKLADAPRVPRREVHPLDPTEARAFLGAITGDRMEALYVTALGTGLRQGELLGLSWRDVDLEAGTIRVRQALQRNRSGLVLVEPKSATSHRTVALPGVVVTALRSHRMRQLQERLAAAGRWPDDPRDLVFLSTVGTPLEGVNVTRRFQALLADAGLPRQRFHDLRHACATLLLAQGVAPRVVMETLGHSQISLTMNTYSHVVPSMTRHAADRMDEALVG
jgi:integrase